MKLYTMKRMLVCTDFSESSDLVIMAAEELRKRNGGSIDLLHISEIGHHIDSFLTPALRESFNKIFHPDLKDSISSQLKAQVTRCRISANTICREGSVGDVIVQVADEGNHDLIVMGHGKQPLVKQVIGSNAFKVISHTPLPLFLVKSPLSLNKVAGLVDESRVMERIIIGTLDFFRNFKCREVEFISLWANLPEPFSSPEEGIEREQKLKEEAEYYTNPGEKITVRVEQTHELKLAYPIVSILEKNEVDVAVLKKFSEGNLKRVYVGSTTKRLLELFGGNILILPP